MKKYLLLVAMIFTMGLVITGCGEKAEEETPEADTTPAATAEETPEATPAPIVAPSFDDMDLSQVVKLPKYKGMELEKVIHKVTEEGVDAQISSTLENTPVEDEDGVVDDGDTANIDYEGKADDVPFDGGTDQGYNLKIGSGAFIPGFEEQLIGMKKGETKDIDITFPEDYHSEDLQGKDVVFTVKINEVKRVLEEPNDEWVEANTEYKTVAEYRESVEKSISDYNEQMAESDIAAKALNKLFEEAEIEEYPEVAVEYGKQLYEQNVQQYADYSGQTIEEFVESQGMTMEQYNEDLEKTSKDIAKQVLVLNAVAQAEGIKEGDEMYKEMMAQIVEEMQMPEETLFETYGEDNIKQNVLVRSVQKIILDGANVKEVAAEDVVPKEGDLPEGHSADDGHDH